MHQRKSLNLQITQIFVSSGWIHGLSTNRIPSMMCVGSIPGWYQMEEQVGILLATYILFAE